MNRHAPIAIGTGMGLAPVTGFTDNFSPIRPIEPPRFDNFIGGPV